MEQNCPDPGRACGGMVIESGTRVALKGDQGATAYPQSPETEAGVWQERAPGSASMEDCWPDKVELVVGRGKQKEQR